MARCATSKCSVDEFDTSTVINTALTAKQAVIIYTSISYKFTPLECAVLLLQPLKSNEMLFCNFPVDDNI